MRHDTKAQKIGRYFANMARLGISYQDADALRLIEMTLHRWSEQECGDSNNYQSWAIERDDETGKPFRVVHSYNGPGSNATRSYPIADSEAGALKRAAAIMARYPDLFYYHQGDPRGCSLYILKKSDYPADKQAHGCDVDYTRGVAVCI